MLRPNCHLVTRPDAAPSAPGWSVFVPALDRFAPPRRDLLSMLPVADVNGALARALETGPAPPDAVGLLLVDPFLNLPDMAALLKAAGLRAVANYPTVQTLTGESARALASVGYGLEQECALLHRFGELGFETVGYAASPAAALALVQAGVSRLVAYPGVGLLDDRSENGIAEAAGGLPLGRHLQG